jgi:MacB-like protein/FtsX-like permease family protein
VPHRLAADARHHTAVWYSCGMNALKQASARLINEQGLAWLDGFLYDRRLTLRGLRRDWAFTLAAIGILTLAIALNVTVYTVTDAMLFRGYPLVNGNDRLVYLQEHGPAGACCMLYPDFEEWRSQAQSFEGMAFVGGRAIAFRDGDGRPIDMRATTLSANTFGLLGVPPLLGRDFVPADEGPGAAPVAILNYRFWDGRFNRRADIVGLTVHINGAPATVIGVMPERFDFPLPATDDLWMPVVHTPELQQRDITAGGFTVVGRLRNRVSLREARAELETINRCLGVAYPATNRHLVPTVATHSQFNSGRNATMIWGSFWAAAWFVWLIACANVANLTLVRTMGRWRELSTRIALGAGQGRMMRQMFTESLVLTGVAGAIGWWITVWSVRTWVAVTASRYQVLDYTVDSGTLAYLVAISVAAALLCSLAPIGRVVQHGVSGALKGDARGVTQGLRGKHMAAALVAGQMALAIVLLSGTGVLVRSFVTIVSAETGVRDPDRILVGSMRLPSDKYPTPAARLGYFEQVERQLKTVPGTEAEAVASTLPVNELATRWARGVRSSELFRTSCKGTPCASSSSRWSMCRSIRSWRRPGLFSPPHQRASTSDRRSRSRRGAGRGSGRHVGRVRHDEGQLQIRSRLHGCRAQRVGKTREGRAHFCRGGPPAVRHRALCRDRLFREPTHKGDWRANGHRRGGARYPPLDLPRRPAPRDAWVTCGPDDVARCESHPAIATRRRLALRSRDVGERTCRVDSGRADRVPNPFAVGSADRSSGRLAA